MAGGSIGLRLFAMRAWVVVVVLLLLERRGVNGKRDLRHFAPPHRATLHTIQSPDGDIVDCVLRHHQPALEHPLLANHTIQELPSLSPSDDHKTQDEYSSHEIFQVWHQNEKCPFGTIPILRKDPSQSIHEKHTKYPTKHPHQFSSMSKNVTKRSLATTKFPNHEYATTNYEPTNAFIYGASVTSNQWNPFVELDNEFSLSQIWITAGKYEGSDLNTIEIGWQVFPAYYQDRQTRLFVYWTADYYNVTGCYNLKCPGFVQVDNSILLGGAIQQLSSTYEGFQEELPQILVFKDTQTQNWWVRYGTQYLGYWPKELFTHLATYGERVSWGGEIINNLPGGYHTTTQMGSGHFANEGYQRACYARSLAFVDSTNHLYNISMQELTILTTNPSCYNIELQTFTNWGTSFFFGGPRKNPNCP